MIRTLIWFIYFWLYLLCVIPVWIRLKRLAKRGREAEVDDLLFKEARKWARALLNLAGAKVFVEGAEHVPVSGPVLFVCNHQGNFDIPLLLGYIPKPIAFIAKVEAKKIPFISSWMTMMGCVFMKRNNLRQSLEAIQEGSMVLKTGRSLVIFPEGTRSKSSRLGPFKPGSLKLALQAQVPIVPVTINGTYKLMERQGFLIRPAEVSLTIAKPILSQGEATARDLANQVREVIQNNLREDLNRPHPDRFRQGDLVSGGQNING